MSILISLAAGGSGTAGTGFPHFLHPDAGVRGKGVPARHGARVINRVFCRIGHGGTGSEGVHFPDVDGRGNLVAAFVHYLASVLEDGNHFLRFNMMD